MEPDRVSSSSKGSKDEMTLGDYPVSSLVGHLKALLESP